jgi:hypothetical protein
MKGKDHRASEGQEQFTLDLVLFIAWPPGPLPRSPGPSENGELFRKVLLRPRMNVSSMSSSLILGTSRFLCALSNDLKEGNIF